MIGLNYYSDGSNISHAIIVKADRERINQVISNLLSNSRLCSKFVAKLQQGTRLGLFISNNIIESHGGKIWAERGTVFQSYTAVGT